MWYAAGSCRGALLHPRAHGGAPGDTAYDGATDDRASERGDARAPGARVRRAADDLRNDATGLRSVGRGNGNDGVGDSLWIAGPSARAREWRVRRALRAHRGVVRTKRD